jgi:succinyl-diaminopimelate desuccinylase
MTIGTSLGETLLSLTRIDSPIGEERALCDYVAARLARTLPATSIERMNDSLVVRANRRPQTPRSQTPRSQTPRIALVGHLDTVRTQHDGPPRIEGDRLYGCGASDMKSGLAIMLELVERLDLETLPYELTLVFYEREEGPYEENMLGPLLDRFDELHQLDLAICLEPSDNRLHLGCMGSVHATVVFEGRTAHSARPWQGENAITKALPFLGELARREMHAREVDGLVYREVASPTLAQAGRARNIIPDRFEVNVNYRFAPGRTPEEAVEEIARWAEGHGRVEPTDLSPSGRPHRTHWLVRHLEASGVRAVEPKQAWTDVARFDRIGVPGVNLGPGLNAQAHQRNEYTDLPLLVEGYGIFERFLTRAPSGNDVR